MGADSVRLFHKSLSDQILVMKKSDLILFLEENLGVLKQRQESGEFIFCEVLDELEEGGGSIAETIERMIAQTHSLAEIKYDLVINYAFGEERIYLDYWGCYAHVFSEGDPNGSISSMEYFGETEGSYLFLMPAHVDLMIRSLKEHLDDLPVMEKEGIERLEHFRDFCLSDPNYMIAYEFDY